MSKGKFTSLAAAVSIFTFSACSVFSGKDQEKLPSGLLLHFDASQIESIELQGGNVLRWSDVSGNGNDATATEKEAPEYSGKAFNGLGMITFSGSQQMKTRPLNLQNGISVFMVFRRELPQKSERFWQTGLYWGDGKAPDNTPSYHLSMGRTSEELSMRIFCNSSRAGGNNPLVIGANANKSGCLSGDVGEILVFDKAQMSPDDIETVRNYLLKKWNFVEDEWVRMGALPKTPERINDSAPLSDQSNLGKWKKVEKLCDEFDGTELKRDKWTDLSFYSYGSGPARFLPQNVVVKDGMLQLSCHYDKNLPSGRFVQRGQEFHSYTTAIVKSMNLVRYGYFEIRSKIVPSAMACNFWMIGSGVNLETGALGSPEIDVYELAGKSFAHTYSYNMALHYVQRKPESKHFAYGAIWKSNFNFTDDFHVYGLEWTPDLIKYYIDGVAVRSFKVRTNYWDMPMIMSMDILAQFTWFGVPDEKDFPGTYYIDYVRVWKNPATDLPDDWDKKYKITNLPRDTGATYDYFKKYGKTMEFPVLPERKTISSSLGACNSLDSVKFWTAHDGAGIEWLDKTPAGSGGLKLTFPAMAERKDNGEVQYSSSAKSSSVALKSAAIQPGIWKDYEYLALDFYNSLGVQAASVEVRYGPDKKLWSQKLIMKHGQGTHYMKLSPEVQKEEIMEISINVRGSDKPNEFYLTDLRLEK